jgi:hypothetical protein
MLNAHTEAHSHTSSAFSVLARFQARETRNVTTKEVNASCRLLARSLSGSFYTQPANSNLLHTLIIKANSVSFTAEFQRAGIKLTVDVWEIN